MLALTWDGHSARVEERPLPQAATGAALVRVSIAGICSTDLEIVRGYMGFRGVLGHEMVGVVVEGPSEWLDRRVVAEINFDCGSCDWCAKGLGRHCPNRRVMGILAADGALAEYVAVPVRNLLRVPDGVSDRGAVFTEPTAAAFEILDQVALRHDLPCVVLGDGKLGMLVAQVMATAGAKVLVVGRHLSKLERLAALGIDTITFDAWDRAPAPLVVEATGTAAGFEVAMAATQPRGTLVLKSTVATGAALNLAPLVINEITLVGSRCGRFAPALEALASGRVQTDLLVSDVIPLHDAARALDRAAQPGVLKVLVDCQSSQPT